MDVTNVTSRKNEIHQNTYHKISLNWTESLAYTQYIFHNKKRFTMFHDKVC